MRARTEKISDEEESDRQPTLPLLWFMAKNAEETETGNQAERIKGMVGDILIVRKSSLRLKMVVIYRKKLQPLVVWKTSLKSSGNPTETIFEGK